MQVQIEKYLAYQLQQKSTTLSLLTYSLLTDLLSLQQKVHANHNERMIDCKIMGILNNIIISKFVLLSAITG
jgi:hypothetical protein